MTKIAINGFGRIGRAAFRSIFVHDVPLSVVAINDLGNIELLAHLLRYDSVYGPFKQSVAVKNNSLLVGKEKIRVFSEPNPEKLPWRRVGVDVVLECTGVFSNNKDCSKHIKAGARLAVISANSKTETTPHFVLGVNEKDFDSKKHKVSAMCSCTTNCATPVIKTLNDNFGVMKAHMLTIHAVTSTQNLIDGHHKDWRRARSALVNTIPTTTGAAKAVTRVLPELKGRISGSAMRVPVACGSILEVVASVEKEASVSEINSVFEKQARKMKKDLAVSLKPLVSSDIIKSTQGAIVDLSCTEVLDLPEVKDENLVKVIAWYDNEYAYSYRLARFAEYIGKL
jgi:glyceraldehyde 3-phosphate dehydrogenase